MLVSRSLEGCDLAIGCEFAVRHMVVGCYWSVGWADEKNSWKRVQSGEVRLASAGMSSSLFTSNHNDLQRIMAVASLHFPNLVQIFLLAQANSEPNRKEDSKM